LSVVPCAPSDFASVLECLQCYATLQDPPLDDNIIQLYQDKAREFEADQGSKAFPMSLFWLYTTESWVYKEVNKVLREDSISMTMLAPYMKALIESYRSFSDYCYHGYVYRRTRLNPSQFRFYHQDRTFIWSAFTSTTKNEAVAENPDFGNTLFKIEIPPNFKNYALWLTKLSAFPLEDEVLLCPNIAYRVVNVEEKDDESVLINVIMAYVCLAL